MSKLTPCRTATRLCDCGHSVELLHGGPDLSRIDQLADPGRAGLGEQDEADALRRALLVALQGVERLRRDRPRDRASTGRSWRRRIDSTSSRSCGASGEPQRRQQAEANRLAVAVALVAAGRLDRVADGVAEVEHRAPAGVALVGGDDLALVAGAGEDQLGEPRRDRALRARAPAPRARRRPAGPSSATRRSPPPAPRGAGWPGSRCRPGPPRAAGRRRRSSCPQAGRHRSCRRRRSRPGRREWSAPGRPGRRAGRGGRRSRRGRRRRRRRGRRRGPRGSSRHGPARAAPARPRPSSSPTRRARPRSRPASGLEPLGVERTDRGCR